MTLAGWILMVTAVGGVLVWNVWCFSKVLRKQSEREGSGSASRS